MSNFDLAAMDPGGLKGTVAKWLFDEPQWWMRLLRNHWPVARLPFTDWTIVTRFDHVQEALHRQDVFQVPFGPRMKEMTAGPNFVLGMQDGPDYQRDRAHILEAFRREDVTSLVGPLSAKFAAAIVERGAGRVDAIEDLITRVPTLLCESYYGVPIADKRAFAQWTIAMSGYMFGPPGDAPQNASATARAAAALIRPVIDDAIRGAKAAPARDDTVLGRFVTMQRNGAEGLSDEAIRGHLFGMITGFIPTNTIAAGNVLEMLLRRPEFLAAAQAAARAGDDERLWRCLSEAMRFKPINPGPFRVCGTDAIIGTGNGAHRVRAGTRLLVSTQSAMFDERHVRDPERFDPARPMHEYMLFGHGLHWCIGAYIAQAQITETFKPLLRRKNLRRAPGAAGRMQQVTLFPVHLVLEFDK